jgi:beta-galactosidase
MKQRLLLLLLIQPMFLLAQGEENNVRITQLFNFDWKFQLGENKDAQSVEFDDSSWRSLDLPHDFQIEQAWSKSGGAQRGYKAMGTAWYRKSFKADPSWKGKRVLLDLEGVMIWGEVWFNGRKIKDIDFGYLGVEAELTKHLNYEGDNVIAIYTSTGQRNNSRWYTGGGLFRDVHLVVKDAVAIARHGVFITTPKISEDKAEVNIQVELEGISYKKLDVEIHAKIFSPDGRQVATVQLQAPKGERLSTVEVPLPTAIVKNPQLWSCETPNLYKAEVSLIRDGKKVDQLTETFGIRTIEYSPEFGLKLNGKQVFLKGISNHHDLGAVGAAAYERAIERQFLQLKKFGFNHVRTSHNPYSESFMRLADKHGILIVDELCDKWTAGRYWPGKKSFFEIWYKIVPEWIKRDRNHPSVIMWSFGNELQHREDLWGFPTTDWGVTTYKILDVMAKRYDPTRKTTVGLHPSRAKGIDKNFTEEFKTIMDPPELALVTDIASLNYRYVDFREYRNKHPELIIYQSEAATNELAAPYFGMDQTNTVGLAYWGAIKYWGESLGWPRKGWHHSFFEHTLEPLPQAYLIKSAFTDEPLVRIAVVDGEAERMEWNEQTIGSIPVSSHWNRPTGSVLNLFTYTNADEVELLVNGKSLGIKKNETENIRTQNMIYWENVSYGKGGKIVAVARKDGKEVARHQLETTGKATALHAEVENSDWKSGGMDLQYIRVYAVDSKGRKVPDYKGEVTFEISGESRLIAVDNGDHATNKIFSENNKIDLYNGFAMAILRSTQNAGETTMKVSVKGLKSVERKLITNKY